MKADGINRIIAIYHLKADSRHIDAKARDICYEQTVEIPEELTCDDWIKDNIVGRIENIRDLGEDIYEVHISYSTEITGFTLPGLLNVVYGNISLKKGIVLWRLYLPEDFTSRFTGPAFGIEGVRELLQVYHRSLLAAPLKPIGTNNAKLGDLCYELACGGIDIVKDDHGLCDQSFSPFRERVLRCLEAVNQAYRETGRRTLYFPCVTGDFESMEDRILWAKDQGVGGILISPMITGIDYLRFLASGIKINLPIMAHPSLMGAFFSDIFHGISHQVLLGTFMRLAGADMVIYPNFCGRFPFRQEVCLAINNALKEPFYYIKSSLPVPAGGISLENIPFLKNLFGNDVIFLVGSSLFSRSIDMRDNARYFLSLVEHE